jgi:glycerate-2-kinase
MLFTNEKQIIDNGSTNEIKTIRKHILQMLNASIKSVNAYNAVSNQIHEKQIKIENNQLKIDDYENIYLASFGKASIGMSQAIIDKINIKKGVIITNETTKKINHPNIETYIGGHPIPNQGSINGTKAIQKLIASSSKNDLIIILISGGGSALLCNPKISLNDMQKTTIHLLKSSATIQEINTIRKHLSYVKGGQLIKNVKGRAITFIISDVVGDPIEFIASGPTYPDSTSFQNAYEIFKKYELWEIIPISVKKVINDGLNKKIDETPTKDNIIFQQIDNKIIANNQVVCKSVFNEAIKLGYKPKIITTILTGEAKEVGQRILKEIKEKKQEGYNLFIFGGETTVTVKGSGKGGRNQEMVLAVVEDIYDKNIIFSSFATDGIDGMSDAAGAIADKDTYQKSVDKNLKISDYLNDNNSYEFFKLINDLLFTGPTGTNVMDIQIIVRI